MSDQSKKGVEKEDANLRLAADRTRLAYERTMMAWIRTAISLITFGFAMYKFFQIMVVAGAERPRSLLSPREFGLIMISIGLLGLLLAVLQQWRDLKALKMHYPHLSGYSPARMLAAFVAILGLLALLAVFFRQ